ncbi:MAG: bifunctional adenosylcobinamide kinase/adenosylcobinamide-phosphate guanylyltransferase [Lachnospiraceae bacterium]|nr:bifunctional adenosylcobinamide kinase/adenosylcobinamide-phosphate guanylyltransferase [Lachnospiraceae bacterium]
MITLVYGGSSSGKSEFAENLVCKSGCANKYYLATMKPTPDTAERIKRHKNLREGKGFFTLEYERDIVKAVYEVEKNKQERTGIKAPSQSDRILLLECMSNLVANEMFREGKIMPKEYCEKKIISDIMTLKDEVSSLVIVSNNVFEDGVSYAAGTKEYLRCLGGLNRTLAEMADKVYEVVVGIGIKL